MKLKKEDLGNSTGFQLAVWEYSVRGIATLLGKRYSFLDIRIRHEEIIRPSRGYLEKTSDGVPHYRALADIGWTQPMIRRTNVFLADARKRIRRS